MLKGAQMSQVNVTVTVNGKKYVKRGRSAHALG